MQIDANTVLAGQPILQIWKVLRWASDGGCCTPRLVEQVPGVGWSDRGRGATVIERG